MAVGLGILVEDAGLNKSCERRMALQAASFQAEAGMWVGLVAQGAKRTIQPGTPDTYEMSEYASAGRALGMLAHVEQLLGHRELSA